MSAFSYTALSDYTHRPDQQTPNIWDAAYRDLHLRVPASQRLLIDSRWQANAPGIAEYFLGSKFFWWVILMYNGLHDPIKDLAPGVTILLPSGEALRAHLSTVASQQSATNFLNPNSVTVI